MSTIQQIRKNLKNNGLIDRYIDACNQNKHELRFNKWGKKILNQYPRGGAFARLLRKSGRWD